MLLRSCDGEVCEIDTETAKISILLKEMMENGLGSGEEEVPLSNVKSETLKKVIEWMDHQRKFMEDELDEEKAAIDSNDRKIPEWDAAFLDVSHGMLFDLIAAANYLDIKDLLFFASKTVALMIKGKTPEEIRTYFEIENDFTDEEKKEMTDEVEWCSEKL